MGPCGLLAAHACAWLYSRRIWGNGSGGLERWYIVEDGGIAQRGRDGAGCEM